jgi:hypothetical protein
MFPRSLSASENPKPVRERLRFDLNCIVAFEMGSWLSSMLTGSLLQIRFSKFEEERGTYNTRAAEARRRQQQLESLNPAAPAEFGFRPDGNVVI